MHLTRRMKIAVTALLFAVCVYFLAPCVYVCFFIDRNTIKTSEKLKTLEDRTFEIPCPEGRSVLIRRYGSSDSSRCVVFFPGSHGGIPRYEKTWFKDMLEAGMTVYALSYPGQDGAQGSSRLSTVGSDVETALDALDAITSGRLHGAVFVGRSLGATVAVMAASRFHPKALLLEGVSPSLSDAVRAFCSKQWFTTLWNCLPLEHLMADDHDILSSLKEMRGTPIWIFQGDRDETTPLKNLNKALYSLPWINVVPVPGGTHGESYRIARKTYLSVLNQLIQ